VVEVWELTLKRADGDVRRLADMLADDERARAERFAGATQRRRWVVARAGLRILLAERLGTAPGALVFDYGEHGKPELEGADLRFNIAHAGDVALIALAERRDVGIDVERTDRVSRAVERALTAAERAALEGLAGEARHLALLRTWCRKEALAKAGGRGLAWAPERFDTTAPGGYAVADAPMRAGYVAAVAAAGAGLQLTRHRLEL
jgi:4'-phosphopantetheinyl transferase